MPLFIIAYFTMLILIVRSLVKDSVSLFFVLAFLGYWFVSIFVSGFNPYGLHEVSFITYIFLLLNVTSFVVGFSFLKMNGSISKNPIKIGNITKNLFFNLVVVIGIAIVIFLSFMKQQYLDDSKYDAAEFRADFFEILFEDNFLLLCAYYLFLYPLFYFLLTLIGYMFFFNRSWRIALYSIYIIPFMLLGEGRSQFLILGLIFLLIFVIFKEKRHIKMGIRTIIVGLLFITAILFGMITATKNRLELSTTEASEKLGETIVVYSTGPFRALDFALTHRYIEKAGGYKYGRASFCGFDFLFQRFCSRLGIKFEPVKTTTNDELQNSQVTIGKNWSINYSYTNVIYHYYDFGIIGVLIIPCCFGLFCRLMIRRFYRLNDLSMLAIITFLFFIALHTTFSWYFNKMFTVPYIVVLLFLSREKKSRLFISKK